MTPPTVPMLGKGPLTESGRRAIEEYLVQVIPPGATGAALGVITKDGISFGAAMRLGDRWELAGGVERAWSGDISGQVVVMGSW
jgi:hypothetical protein